MEYLKKSKYKIFLKKFQTGYIISKKYQNWLKDEKITKYTKIKSSNNLNDIKKYIKDGNSNNSYLFKITVKRKKNLSHIGNIRFTIKKNSASMALIIGNKKFHNSGIGSQVIKKGIMFLRKKKIKKIYAYISKYNIPSIKAFQRNNFKKISGEMFKYSQC